MSIRAFFERIYRDFNFSLYDANPPVIHNYRYKARV